MKNNYFLIVVLAGLLIFAGLRVTGIIDPDRSEFVKSCTNHGVFVIEKACKEMGIMDEFTPRKATLQEKYVQYCDCVADIWRDRNLKLRASFFEEQAKPSSQRNDYAKKVEAWIRLPATRGEYARCFNSTRMNLTWMADAHTKLLKSQAPKKDQSRPR